MICRDLFSHALTRVWGPCLINVFAFASTALAADPVTTCGQHVSGSGVLTADLDCTGFADAAVVVESGRLDLAGFTLTGGDAAGVRCDASCTIESEPAGGTITGAAGAGVDGAAGGNYVSVKASGVVIQNNGAQGIVAAAVTLENVTVDGNAGFGVESAFPPRVTDTGSSIINNGDSGVFLGEGPGFAPKRSGRFTGSTISGNGGDGVEAHHFLCGACGAALNIRDSLISNNAGFGVSATEGTVSVRDTQLLDNGDDAVGSYGVGQRVIKARNVTVTGPSHGLYRTSRMRVRESTFAVSEVAIFGTSVRVMDTTINGSSVGILGLVARVTNTTVTDCSFAGVSGNRVRLVNSQVTGTGGDPNCGVTFVCADVDASDEPTLDALSSCETSYVKGSGFPGQNWGVCTLD